MRVGETDVGPVASGPTSTRAGTPNGSPRTSPAAWTTRARGRPISAAIVAGTGPGPFTGLRVGLVTAAALADTLGIPAYGVCSLDAIGDSARDEPELLVVTDARRKEVYWARYAHGVRTAGPDVGKPADVAARRRDRHRRRGQRDVRRAWPDVPRRLDRYPSPWALVRCALDRIRAAAPSEQLTPLYLRRPDAVEPGAPKPVTQ